MATQVTCDGCGVVQKENAPIHDVEFKVIAATVVVPGSTLQTRTLVGQLCDPCVEAVEDIVKEGE